MVGLGLWSVGKGCVLDSFCAFMYADVWDDEFTICPYDEIKSLH